MQRRKSSPPDRAIGIRARVKRPANAGVITLLGVAIELRTEEEVVLIYNGWFLCRCCGRCKTWENDGQGRGGGGRVGVRGNDVVVVQLAGDLEDGGDDGNL